eukprot:4161615-Amphidinium_carterae.1
MRERLGHRRHRARSKRRGRTPKTATAHAQPSVMHLACSPNLPSGILPLHKHRADSDVYKKLAPSSWAKPKEKPFSQ